MTNNYFNPAPAHDRNVSQRISKAYAAAGITAPSSFATALKRHLLTVPDVKREAASIAAEAYNAAPDTDVHEFWDSAVDQVIRAQGADTLKTALTSALDVQERASAQAQIDRAMTDLKPWAERQCKALKTAAGKLPAGPAALDPEAVLADDAGAALTAARRALSTLALWASIPDTGVHVSSAMQLARVLPVLDPGKVTVEARTHLGRTVNEDSLEATNSLRRLERDVRTDIDRALIGVARSEYPGLALSPVTALADVKARARTIRDAFITRSVDEATANKMVAMR